MNAPRTEIQTPDPERLLLEALEERWKKTRLELKHCRAEFSNEAVHDLRIALRRLLSLIQLLNSISPRPRLRKLVRALKNKLDDFDDLRDTQVLLAEISENVLDFPQLQKLQKRLERVEKDLLRELRKKIKKPELAMITRRIRKTHKTLKDESKDNLIAPILQSVDDAFLITMQRHGYIDSAQPATIHRVRIAFKTFRYMLEIVHPMLNKFPEENLDLMNNHQSLMGEIQDLEIFIQALIDIPQNASSFDVEPVRRYYKTRHAEAISAFMKDKDVINTFWRHAPNDPFPWEKTE